MSSTTLVPPRCRCNVLIGCSATSVLWVRSSPIAPLMIRHDIISTTEIITRQGRLSSLCWPCSLSRLVPRWKQRGGAVLTESHEALAREVLIHGPIGRSALGRRLGLSPASLTRLAKPFLERGLFIELDEESTGAVGRPVRPLEVAPDLGCVRRRQDHRRCGIRGADRCTRADPRRADAPAHHHHTRCGRRRARVRRVSTSRKSHRRRSWESASASAVPSTTAGRVVRAPFLGWVDVEFGKALASATGLHRHRRERRRRPRRGGAVVRRGPRSHRVLGHHHRRGRRLRAGRRRRVGAHPRGRRRPRRTHPPRPDRPALPRGAPRLLDGTDHVGRHVRSGAGGPRPARRVRRGALPRRGRRPGGDERWWMPRREASGA